MISAEKEICRLCGEKNELFFGTEFYSCNNCCGISRKSSSLPDAEKEKKRYDHHQNSPDDGYVDFISPLINHIINTISIDKKGLDFGSGPESVISKILSEKHYNISKYDPFYENNLELLKEKYDFIIAIEVVEHFHSPSTEFEKMKNQLKENGELLIMTHLYDESIDFGKWYYKNDFTHVFFYTKECFNWIKTHFQFKEMEINDRFIRLKN